MPGNRTPSSLLIVAGLITLLSATAICAAPWETLPPDHWAYEEIRWLQVAGFLRELNPSHKPYTRGEIATALQANSRPVPESAAGRYRLLEAEFAPEMRTLGGWHVFAGARAFAGLEATHGQSSREAGYGVISGGVGNPRLGVYTALRADRDLVENDAYRGKIWNNIAGLTESAYFVIIGNEQRWDLKLGRDHRYWGPGDDHLILNQGARGLDQISFRIRWKWGEFTSLVGQVDDFEESTGDRLSRFLSGHRLEFLPWSWLRLGLSETLLFDGGIRLGSMNPLLPYYGELVNESSAGNGFLGLDAVAYPYPGLETFGEFLLDDVQIEKKTSADLEPPEWAWLLGFRWAASNGLLGVGASYSGVTNRTYNALEPQYRYLNYGLPLGSDLGNDADRLRLEISCWPEARLHVKGFWEYARQGEGGVTAPFDTSYMNYTLDEGYTESFPTGIVQKTHTLGFAFSILPHRFLQAEGWIGHEWVENALHIADQRDEGFKGRITLNVRVDHLRIH